MLSSPSEKAPEVIFLDGYQRISKYKAHLMGLAILVVVYGHLLYYHSGLKNYEDLNFTIWYTLGSVEMFMFVSGFGIYQSLLRNRDAFTFYRKRLSRLAPSYLPVMTVYCIFGMLFSGMRLGDAVGNLTAMGWWFGLNNQFNWYVPATVVLYLLSPLFFDCIQRLGKKSVGMFVALFVLIVAGWRSNLLLALTRFPTYFLGMYFGARYAEGKTPTGKQLLVWSVVGVMAMALVPYYFLYRRDTLWYYGMYWILFFFSTPACMFGTTKLLHWQQRFLLGRGLNRLWRFLGNCSFEIFLCHLSFYELCLRIGVKGWPKWIVIAFTGICIGVAYHYALDFIQKKWRLREKTV